MLLFQLPSEGTPIVVFAKDLKSGKRYVSLYYDNDHCALDPYSEDDDLDEINSVSVRSARSFRLLACATIQN